MTSPVKLEASPDTTKVPSRMFVAPELVRVPASVTVLARSFSKVPGPITGALRVCAVVAFPSCKTPTGSGLNCSSDTSPKTPEISPVSTKVPVPAPIPPEFDKVPDKVVVPEKDFIIPPVPEISAGKL